MLVMEDALFPLAHVDGRSTHHYRENADKDEIVSGASINQGVLLLSVYLNVNMFCR